MAHDERPQSLALWTGVDYGDRKRESERRHDSPDEGKRREAYQLGNDSGTKTRQRMVTKQWETEFSWYITARPNAGSKPHCTKTEEEKEKKKQIKNNN